MVNYEPDRIFVGGLPPTCDANDKLTVFFQQYGAVRESKVFVDLDTGRPKGFGFVRFESAASVEVALSNDANNIIDGKWVSAKRCEVGGAGKQGGGSSWIGSPNSLEDAGLWIRGLPLEYTEGLLKAFAEQYGEVVDVKILPRRYPNNPDQAGLLRMKTVEQANWLVENLNGRVIDTFPMPLSVRKSSKDKQKQNTQNSQPAAIAPASTWGVAPPATTTVAVQQQQHQPYVVPPFNLSGQQYQQQYQYQADASAQYNWSGQYQYQADGGYQQAQYSAYGVPQQQQQQQTASNGGTLSTDRLWIRGLPMNYTDNDLRELFSRFGTVSDCKVLPQKYPQNPDLSGVVRMSTPAEAALCLDQLNNHSPPGFSVPIHMRYARDKGAPAQPSNEYAVVPAHAPAQGGIEPDRIFIGGLPDSCDDATLALFFSQFGSVMEAKVSLDPHTQRSRGFGFVRFSDASAPLQAIANGDGNIIDGKRVIVKPSQVQNQGGAAPQPDQAASSQAWGYASTQQDAGSVGDGCGLFIRGLPLSYDHVALKAFFEQWVTVVDSKVLPRRFVENPDQAGLVRVASAEQAQWCVQVLDGTQPAGFPMAISVKLSTSTAPAHSGAQASSTFATQQDVAPFALTNTAEPTPALTPVVVPPFITQPAESAPAVAPPAPAGLPPAPGCFDLPAAASESAGVATGSTEEASQGVKRSSEGLPESEAKVQKV